jgi:copper homeostasis protein
MPKASSDKVLEVACFDVESCFIAEQAGADRIEFCSDYNSGGVTPLWDDILKVRERLKIPLHVIIRPREGNFVYIMEEIDMMKRDIFFCKEHKIDGLVFGVLNPDNTVNKEITKELLDLAKPMSLTFHRAIDACVDMENALEDIIKLGFDRVLTSGGKQTALEGMESLKAYQRTFGKQITIMPGGGIRSHNIALLAASTACSEFHTAALTKGNTQVDAEELKLLINSLKQES